MSIMLYEGRSLSEWDKIEAEAERREAADDLAWLEAVFYGPVPDETLL